MRLGGGGGLDYSIKELWFVEPLTPEKGKKPDRKMQQKSPNDRDDHNSIQHCLNLFKDTQREKAPQNKISAIVKSMNTDI